ncbi:MAG TPA: tetratricopeptide repeat protein [Candidatus Methylacidiphilales bacterium]|nr:tetratricopeptide repeat protein [Candidatus Methylacidiphilales bacterium]
MAKRLARIKTKRIDISTPKSGKAAPAAPLRPWFNRNWLGGMALALAVIVTYTPVWHAGFVWDDDVFVTNNSCIVGPQGLKEIWTTNAADICPLTLTTVWFEHALWGLAPLPYHLVNVLLHAACAVLLGRVLLSLQVPGAWLGAALWALHPVQTESVAWITEIKNTQSGLFFLLSILFYVKYLRASDSNSERKPGGGWSYGWTLLFAALTMTSKSSTVVLPVILCLCAWWMEGEWRWRNLARIAPIFLMSVAACALSIWTQGEQPMGKAPDPQWARTWPERLVTAGDAIWFYLSKLLWPYPLIPIYPRWEVGAGQPVAYLPLLAVIIIFIILWFGRSSWSRSWFFVFAYFLAALFPVLGLVDVSFFRYSLVADHFQYLASMGPLTLAGAGLARFLDLVLPGRCRLQSALGAGLSLILGVWSWEQARVYENPEALWNYTLSKNPKCPIAYFGLGTLMYQGGLVDKAIVYYQTALALYPNYAEVRSNLGNAFFHKGEVHEAMLQYQQALESNPHDIEAHYNFGNAFLLTGRVDEAIEQYQEALQLNADNAAVLNNLGLALARKGQLDAAIFRCQKAIKIDPNYDEAHNNLGLALLQKGQRDEALAEFQKAAQINPNYVEAHNNVGWVLLQKGELEKAISQFQEALRLNPNYARAEENLSKAEAMIRQQAGQK